MDLWTFESRQSASNGFIPAKKLKHMLPEVPMEDVDKAANAAAAQTSEEVAAIIKNSRQVSFIHFHF